MRSGGNNGNNANSPHWRSYLGPMNNGRGRSNGSNYDQQQNTTNPRRDNQAALPPPGAPNHRHRQPLHDSILLPARNQPHGWLAQGEFLMLGRHYPITAFSQVFQTQLQLMGHQLRLHHLPPDDRLELESYTDEHLPIYMYDSGIQRSLIETIQNRRRGRENSRQRSNARLLHQFGGIRDRDSSRRDRDSARHHDLLARHLNSQTKDTDESEDGEIEDDASLVSEEDTNRLTGAHSIAVDLPPAIEQSRNLSTNPFRLPTFSIPLLKEIRLGDDPNTHSDHLAATAQVKAAESFLHEACVDEQGNELLRNGDGSKCRGLSQLMNSAEETYGFQYTPSLWDDTRDITWFAGHQSPHHGILHPRNQTTHQKSFCRIHDMAGHVTFCNQWAERFVEQTQQVPNLKRFPITEANSIAKEDRQLEIEKTLKDQIAAKDSQLAAKDSQIALASRLHEKLNFTTAQLDHEKKGACDKDAELVSAKNEIETLQADLAAAKEQAESNKASTQQEAQLLSANKEIAALEVQLTSLRSQLTCKQRQLDSTKSKIDSLTEELDEKDILVAQANNSIETSKEEKDTLTKKYVEKVNTLKQKLKKNVVSLENELDSIKSKLDSTKEELSVTHMRLSTAKKRLATVEEELKTSLKDYESAYCKLDFFKSNIPEKDLEILETNYEASMNTPNTSSNQSHSKRGIAEQRHG